IGAVGSTSVKARLGAIPVINARCSKLFAQLRCTELIGGFPHRRHDGPPIVRDLMQRADRHGPDRGVRAELAEFLDVRNGSIVDAATKPPGSRCDSTFTGSEPQAWAARSCTFDFVV